MQLSGQESKSKIIRVVFDTNVIVSALLWKGKTRSLLKLAEEERIEIFASDKIINELQRVLFYPKFFTFIKREAVSVNDLVERFAVVANLIDDPYDFKIIKEDPSDNAILSCALIAAADYIVTGDNHLLKLKEFQAIQIIRPNQFLALFSPKSQIQPKPRPFS